MVILKEKQIKNTDDYNITYRCDWPLCGFVFTMRVGSRGGEMTDDFGGVWDKVSSQVVCPNCNNGLKTWGR